VKRNEPDNSPAAPGDPGGNVSWRRKEVGNVRMLDERIPIDAVNYPGELDTALEVAVLTARTSTASSSAASLTEPASLARTRRRA
jgi:hypothetical protein